MNLVRALFLLIAVTLLLASGSLSAQEETRAFLAWRPDGAMIAISQGSTVQIIDALTKRTLHTLVILNFQSAEPSWNADGTQLAIANGTSVDIWEYPWSSTDARLIASLEYSEAGGAIDAVDWSPTSDTIVVARGTVDIWRVSTGQPLLTLSGHRFGVTDVEWSPDGSQIATTSLDGTVKIWNAITGHEISTMEVITSYDVAPSEMWTGAVSVTWRPNGNALAFGAADGSVRFWDRNTLQGKHVATIHGQAHVLISHTAGVWAVDWSPDSRFIASGSRDGTIRIWDAAMTELHFVKVGFPVWSLAWSPNSRQLAYINREEELAFIPPPPN